MEGFYDSKMGAMIVAKRFTRVDSISSIGTSMVYSSSDDDDEEAREGRGGEQVENSSSLVAPPADQEGVLTLFGERQPSREGGRQHASLVCPSGRTHALQRQASTYLEDEEETDDEEEKKYAEGQLTNTSIASAASANVAAMALFKEAHEKAENAVENVEGLCHGGAESATAAERKLEWEGRVRSARAFEAVADLYHAEGTMGGNKEAARPAFAGCDTALELAVALFQTLCDARMPRLAWEGVNECVFPALSPHHRSSSSSSSKNNIDGSEDKYSLIGKLLDVDYYGNDLRRCAIDLFLTGEDGDSSSSDGAFGDNGDDSDDDDDDDDEHNKQVMEVVVRSRRLSATSMDDAKSEEGRSSSTSADSSTPRRKLSGWSGSTTLTISSGHHRCGSTDEATSDSHLPFVRRFTKVLKQVKGGPGGDDDGEKGGRKGGGRSSALFFRKAGKNPLSHAKLKAAKAAEAAAEESEVSGVAEGASESGSGEASHTKTRRTASRTNGRSPVRTTKTSARGASPAAPRLPPRSVLRLFAEARFLAFQEGDTVLAWNGHGSQGKPPAKQREGGVRVSLSSGNVARACITNDHGDGTFGVCFDEDGNGEISTDLSESNIIDFEADGKGGFRGRGHGGKQNALALADDAVYNDPAAAAELVEWCWNTGAARVAALVTITAERAIDEMWAAVTKGSIDDLGYPCRNVVDIDARNEDGVTCLLSVALGSKCNVDIANQLLANNADVNAQQTDGQTALYITAATDPASTASNRAGVTHPAVYQPHRRMSGMRGALVRVGSMGDIVKGDDDDDDDDGDDDDDDDDDDDLHHRVDLAELLIDNGANMELAAIEESHVQGGGGTPVFAAARMGNAELVELLAERGADLDRLAADGSSLLMTALLASSVKATRQTTQNGDKSAGDTATAATATATATAVSKVDRFKAAMEEKYEVADVAATPAATPVQMLRCCLNDRPLLARFHAALQSEYAEENLLFWHDVEAYREEASDEDAEPETLQGMMKAIYDR